MELVKAYRNKSALSRDFCLKANVGQIQSNYDLLQGDDYIFCDGKVTTI